MDYNYTIITLLIEHCGYPALSIISRLSTNLHTLCYKKLVNLSRIAICSETIYLLNKYRHFKLVSDSYEGQKVTFYGGQMYDASLLRCLDKLDITSIEYITYNDYCILQERANLYGAKIIIGSSDTFHCFSYITNDTRSVYLTFTSSEHDTINNYTVKTKSSDYLLCMYSINLGTLKLNKVYYDFSKKITMKKIEWNLLNYVNVENRFFVIFIVHAINTINFASI